MVGIALIAEVGEEVFTPNRRSRLGESPGLPPPSPRCPAGCNSEDVAATQQGSAPVCGHCLPMHVCLNCDVAVLP